MEYGSVYIIWKPISSFKKKQFSKTKTEFSGNTSFSIDSAKSSIKQDSLKLTY